uniref:Uncharacterized protein n=1 Tax=Glossina palpalis gambiensis TaxID=67801 RepID=A0A1B0BHR1_9MUSC
MFTTQKVIYKGRTKGGCRAAIDILLLRDNRRFLKKLPSTNCCLSFSIWQQLLTMLIYMFPSAFIPFGTVVLSATIDYDSVKAADTPVVRERRRPEPQKNLQPSVDLSSVDAVGLSASIAVSTCTFMYKSKVNSKTKPGGVGVDLTLSSQGDQFVVIVFVSRLAMTNCTHLISSIVRTFPRSGFSIRQAYLSFW